MTAVPPGADEAPFQLHVVAHTHWDREWYHTAERFRQRLVRLVDELLDAPDAPPFLLDGQAVVLDDYLAVRPERAALLAERLRDGRLEAGPWYVLADQLIPGGEALARNLLAGRRTLARLGADAPPALYSPDSFGHAAAAPLLALEFGLPLAIVWRGYGGRRWPAGDSARWRAPDGRAVVLFHLPPDGYEFGSSLPTHEASALTRWRRIRETLAPRSALGVLLLPNGADHHALQRGQREAVRLLAAAASADVPGIRVLEGGLRAFAREIVSRAGAAALPVVSGELRDSYGYTWTLQGTFASRAHQKRRSAIAERMLVRDVEPWLALAAASARLAAGDRALLHEAWRTLLRCHPHDTLCGCSIDAVAGAMDERLAAVEEQGSGLREGALHWLAGHDPVAAREERDAWRPIVVVRNRAARARAGVAEIELEIPVADVPVGPGSGARVQRPRRAESVALDGGAIPLQVLEESQRHSRVESPRHYPSNALVVARRALAWVPEVPAYGLRSFAMNRGWSRAEPPRPVVVDASSMGNGRLVVSVAADGTVSMRDSVHGTLDDILAFESVRDLGDLYTHSPRGAPSHRAVFRGSRVRHRGPLRGQLDLRFEVPVASGILRSKPTRLTVSLALDAGAEGLRVSVAGENRATDHRLRIGFRTGIVGPRVLADAAFGPVERRALIVPAEDREAETPPPTAPLHRWVSLLGARRGCAVISDGLAEYEAGDDGTVWVTLLRAVGQLSRHDIPERPGHAGWPADTPLAQCIGPFDARLALLVHRPEADAALDEVERACEDVLLPLEGHTLRSAIAMPGLVEGVALSGAGVALSALKPSDDGAWTVARCLNLREVAVDAEWRFPFEVREARRSRLDETPLDSMPAAGRVVRVGLAPRAVSTILVR